MSEVEKLVEASAGGDLKRVKSLLAGGLFRKAVPVNAPGEGKKTALYVAAGKGQLDVVRHLLESGADPNLTTSWGSAPLHNAFGHRDSAMIVRLLCEHGADPNAECNRLRPLDHAFLADDREAVRVLAGLGADLEKCDLTGQRTPFDRCPAGSRSSHMLAFLEVQDALPAVFRGGKRNLLSLAVSENSVEAAGALLKAGCQAEDHSAHGRSFLELAIASASPALVKLLLDHGADPDAPDGAFGSLAVRVFFEGKAEVFRLLAQRSRVLSEGTDVLEWCTSSLRSEYWRVQEAAIRYLGNSQDPRAVEPLLGLIGRPGGALAIEALGRIGDARAVGPILRVVESLETLKAVQTSDHELIVGIRALCRIGDKRACEPVIRAMERLSSQGGLGLLGELSENLFLRHADQLMAVFSPYTSTRGTYRGASGNEDGTTNCKYDTTRAARAVRQLLGCNTRVSSNILHLATRIKDVRVVTGEGYYYPDGPEVTSLSFEEVRQMAADELERRGNPAYDASQYTREEAWAEQAGR